MNDLGLASAFFLLGQVSQANVFFDESVWLVFIINSFHKMIAKGHLSAVHSRVSDRKVFFLSGVSFFRSEICTEPER